jgi:argininosuccinate lyase
MAFSDGRFRRSLNPQALRFSSSLPVDQRLYREDIAGSIAHVKMLAKQNILGIAEAKKIERALQEIQHEIETGKLPLDAAGKKARFVADDIHMTIESRLIEKVGVVGGKLHTARSRNDQVALDERLYLRSAIQKILTSIREMQKAIVKKAEQYVDIIMPGYTHLQHAQPILLAHHLLAYVSMFDRDRERFEDCIKRVSRSPLGAAALAGTSFPIDRAFVARQVRFQGVIENSIDAVSDRDAQIEFLSACAITMMHLSRLAEELVLWSSREWNFLEISDEFTTGSSIMPQKKNPDIAELVRGKTGRVYGNLMALLTVMKGLPLAYNRDMQEDKEPLFDNADTVNDSLTVTAAMMKTVKFRPDRYHRDLDLLLATDLADYLVKKGMPFRKAHAIVGSIVRRCQSKRLALRELPLREYRSYSRLFEEDLFSILDPQKSISSKRSSGSTSPVEVQKALQQWKKTIGF